YIPQVILAGRRINDGMGAVVAQKVVKLLASTGRLEKARVGVLGLTFKEDVPDLRNSRIPDILEELREYGIEALVHDPKADPEEAMREYGVSLVSMDELHDLDALELAVPHREYSDLVLEKLDTFLKPDGALIDIK